MNRDNIKQGKEEINQLIYRIDKEKKRELIFFSVTAVAVSLAAAYFAGVITLFVCASIFLSSYFILFRLWAFGVENMRVGYLNIMYADERLSIQNQEPA